MTLVWVGFECHGDEYLRQGRVNCATNGLRFNRFGRYGYWLPGMFPPTFPVGHFGLPGWIHKPPAWQASDRSDLTVWYLLLMKRILLAIAIPATLLLASCSGDKGPVAAAPITSTTPLATSSKADTSTAAGQASDARCAPATAELTFLVSSGLSKDGFELTNGTVITEGGLTFYGATTVDSGGKMENRSDVWVIKDNLVYSSSGGARNTTIWTKASDAPLKISAGDERVKAVDQCVVNITTGKNSAPTTESPASVAVTTPPAVIIPESTVPVVTPQAPIGFTGAPNGAPAPLSGKTVAYCMDGPSYQPGTTAFTDGTTGWTQECAS